MLKLDAPPCSHIPSQLQPAISNHSYVSILAGGRKREAERDGCKPVVTVSICSSVNSWIRLPWRPVVGIKIRLMHLATRKKGARLWRSWKASISPGNLVYISPYIKAVSAGQWWSERGFIKCLKCNISSVVGKYAEHCNLLFLQSSDRLTEGFLGFSLKCVVSNWISEHTEF